MNYVGIDISKYKHDCFILSDFGEVVNDGFSFTNNAEGFGRLQKELEVCGQGNVRIGFEATGNYGINLKLFLEEHMTFFDPGLLYQYYYPLGYYGQQFMHPSYIQQQPPSYQPTGCYGQQFTPQLNWYTTNTSSSSPSAHSLYNSPWSI